MNRTCSALCCIFVFAAATWAQSPEPVRFRAIDIYIQTEDQPLAAYQFEVVAKTGDVKIVGVEGGEHPAFQEPPLYDPKALQGGRIILAAFNTGKDLPAGKTRIARIHFQYTGVEFPDFSIVRSVAAASEGREVSANIIYQPMKGGRQ